MMYCTGGIRCERASALLDALRTTTAEGESPSEILMVQGGIDRYLRDHPDGGYWKGKNYLFDRRFEQTPTEKQKDDQVLGRCASCSAPCDEYRGQFECAECKVPVLVCPNCRRQVNKDAASFRCRLCRDGYKGARQQKIAAYGSKVEQQQPQQPRAKKRKRLIDQQPPGATRLFVGNLPYTVRKDDVLEALGGEGADLISWIVDRTTGLFYGSAIVDVKSPERAARLVGTDNNRNDKKTVCLKRRKLRLGYHVGSLEQHSTHVADRPPVVRA